MTDPSDSRRASLPAAPVGGGMKKVLYTVETIRRMGVAPAMKALRANNTCKACGLGMGGQNGGMTNELGEFPAVCNKSVQAQSSDTQPAIPLEVFDHSLDDLRELDDRELAGLGRLTTPLRLRAGAQRFEPVSWDEALATAARRLANTDPARTFFYSSGRASNEAGFVLQLFARVYGTNNVNNCSYYCHQATSEGLATTVGTGTATVELADLGESDLVFLMGANPASNHPRLLHQLEACRARGGAVVVINPAREPGLVRFAVPKSPRSMVKGGSWIASHYLQPNIGTDIDVLNAIGRAVLDADGHDPQFISAHTEGFDGYRERLASLDWHAVEATTGLERAEIEAVAARYRSAEKVVFAWGMGLTHHLHGVANIESVANLALLRGMVGRPGAGLLPLRGHSNVQGIGTIGVKPVLAEDVFEQLETLTGVPLSRRPGYDTMSAMQAAGRGEIDVAFMMGGNLYGSNPDSEWAAQALARIGCQIHLTTLLNRGHLHALDGGEAFILPVAARDEEWQPTTQESMFNFVRLSDGGITRHQSVRPESWIIGELGHRVLADSPIDFRAYQEHSRVREAIARTVPGMEQLASIDVAREEFHINNRLLKSPEFRTPSGRAQFRPHGGHTRVAEGFPYRLTTVRSEGQFNTMVYEDADVYRAAPHRWCVLMHPKDISALGIAAGDRVTLKSATGAMPGVEVVPFDVAPGNLMAYFPEANVLTDTAVDARSGTPSFKCVPVAVQPTLTQPLRAPRQGGQ